MPYGNRLTKHRLKIDRQSYATATEPDTSDRWNPQLRRGMSSQDLLCMPRNTPLPRSVQPALPDHKSAPSQLAPNIRKKLWARNPFSLASTPFLVSPFCFLDPGCIDFARWGIFEALN